MIEASGPLRIERLSVDYVTRTGRASAVSDVSLDLKRGEIVGLVGESGCGKSTLALAAMALLPKSAVSRGRVMINGADLTELSAEERRRLRGNEVSMVVQDPLASLDPTYSVGSQVVEAIVVHRAVRRADAQRQAAELLTSVGIPDAERRMKDPPHRFSGGMRQRAVVAMALANDPSLLIADEPTTALDVTIQDQILRLLRQLRDERGMAVLVISHDLGVVAQLCDRVGVMYAGQLIELGSARELFASPRHPYTRALLAALPSQEHAPGELAVIPGEVPNLENPPDGCRYQGRCPHRMDVCEATPALDPVSDQAAVACWLHTRNPPPPPGDDHKLDLVEAGNGG